MLIMLLQPSEAELVFRTDFSFDVTQRVIKALYTFEFEPLDEPCISIIENEQEHRPDEIEIEICDESDDDN